MESILLLTPRKVNRWMDDYISPGPVAVVGDVLVNEKLKKSCPELPNRYTYTNQSLKRRGAGVQDGTWYNYHNNGLAARANRQSYYDQSFHNQEIGWSRQDLRLQDLKADTRMIAAPQFGFKTLQAGVINAKVTGEQFLPLANGYSPSGISRGNQPSVNTLLNTTSEIGPLAPPRAPIPVEQELVSNVPQKDEAIRGVENIQRQQLQQIRGMNPGMGVNRF